MAGEMCRRNAAGASYGCRNAFSEWPRRADLLLEDESVSGASIPRHDDPSPEVESLGPERVAERGRQTENVGDRETVAVSVLRVDQWERAGVHLDEIQQRVSTSHQA